MGESESITLVPSSGAGAGTCTSLELDLHQILGRVAARPGAAKWLQRVTGRSPRTVKYWLAGDYAPRGDDGLKIARALRAELDAERARLKQFELQF